MPTIYWLHDAESSHRDAAGVRALHPHPERRGFPRKSGKAKDYTKEIDGLLESIKNLKTIIADSNEQGIKVIFDLNGLGADF